MGECGRFVRLPAAGVPSSGRLGDLTTQLYPERRVTRREAHPNASIALRAGGLAARVAGH